MWCFIHSFSQECLILGIWWVFYTACFWFTKRTVLCSVNIYLFMNQLDYTAHSVFQPTHKSHSFWKSDYTGHGVCYWFTIKNQLIWVVWSFMNHYTMVTLAVSHFEGCNFQRFFFRSFSCQQSLIVSAKRCNIG